MIIGIGIDILEKHRIININKKFNKKFSKKILSHIEINKIKNNKKQIEHLTKAFTIKESIVKAIGTGFRQGLSLKNIRINNNILGKPFINKNNKHNKHIKFLITISHEKKITITLTLIIKLHKFN